MYKLKGGLPYNTDCFSYLQGTIQASYAVMRQLLFGFVRLCKKSRELISIVVLDTFIIQYISEGVNGVY